MLGMELQSNSKIYYCGSYNLKSSTIFAEQMWKLFFSPSKRFSSIWKYFLYYPNSLLIKWRQRDLNPLPISS